MAGNRPEYTTEDGSPNASGMLMDKKWIRRSGTTYCYVGPFGRHIVHYSGQGWVRSQAVTLNGGWVTYENHRTYLTLTDAMRDLGD